MRVWVNVWVRERRRIARISHWLCVIGIVVGVGVGVGVGVVCGVWRGEHVSACVVVKGRLP